MNVIRQCKDFRTSSSFAIFPRVPIIYLGRIEIVYTDYWINVVTKNILTK